MGVNKMLKRNCSFHISEDRLDRACYIMQTVGIGEVIKEELVRDEQGRFAWHCFTNTGVILIMNKDKSLVVTLYIATQARVSAMYKGNTPSWIIKMVRKNKVYAEMQNKVKM